MVLNADKCHFLIVGFNKPFVCFSVNDISKYENHRGVAKIKETYKSSRNFDFPKAIPNHKSKINSKKAMDTDKIPYRLVKLAANIIDCRICNSSDSEYFVKCLDL